jgi:hypothetical protein
MQINLTKNEKLVLTFTGVAISAFFALFMRVSYQAKVSSQFDTETSINYKMAKSEQAYSNYNLQGREIDETYEGLELEKIKDPITKKKLEVAAKKTADNKKKEELKKKQAAVAAAKTQAQNLASSTHKTSKVINSNSVVDGTSDVASSNSRSNSETNYAYVNSNNNDVAEATAVPKQNPKINKKTYAQWRELLFTAPNSENLGLFVTALKKNEITNVEFQAMSQDLIDQTDVKQKGLGLMALRFMPSLASLSQLTHLSSTAIGQYQLYVDQSVSAYILPQNISYLNQALQTKDKVLIAKVLNLLNSHLTKFSRGDLTALTDPRNRREGEVVAFSMGNYRSLIPVLAVLGSAQDQQLSPLAQQVTSIIQSSNNVAQN